MLTEEEYKEFVRRSQEDNYFLTPAEKKKMMGYLDNYKTSVVINFSRNL